MTFFQASAEVDRDPRSFWSDFTSKELEVHVVEAEHLDILIDPNVEVLAAELSRTLSKVRESEREGGVSS